MELKTLDIKPKIEVKAKDILEKEKISRVISTPVKSPVLTDIVDEVGEVVYNYLEKFKITQSQNILYLSLMRHYIYNSEELNHVDNVINFKLLNRIPNIYYFLVTMNRLLPLNGNFVGCFLEYGKHKQSVMKSKHSLLGSLFLLTYVFVNRILPRIPIINKVQFLLNRGRLKCLAKDEAKALLEKNGFQVISMVEIDGLTYFISKKISQTKKETASIMDLVNNYRTRSRIINI